MSEDYIELVWVGDQAIVWGYDDEGNFISKMLSDAEASEICELQSKHAMAECEMLTRFLTAKAIEARSGETDTGSTSGESAVA